MSMVCDSPTLHLLTLDITPAMVPISLAAPKAQTTARVTVTQLEDDDASTYCAISIVSHLSVEIVKPTVRGGGVAKSAMKRNKRQVRAAEKSQRK